MIEIFYVVIGACIGTACVFPFTYKTFAKAAKIRAVKHKVTRLDDFLNRTPRYHKNYADDVREYFKHNMDELDDILNDLRAVPSDNQFYGQIQEIMTKLEDMQKEFRWRPSGNGLG